jgi:hypothetical protein
MRPVCTHLVNDWALEENAWSDGQTQEFAQRELGRCDGPGERT